MVGGGSIGAIAGLGTALGFSWNPISNVAQMWSYEFMRNAFEAGTIVALVAGVVGYFVILRRTAFAAHALSHIGFAGATGAIVVGLSPVLGVYAFALGAAAVMGAIGQRLRARDTVIGIVLAFALGIGLFFLSIYSGYATEAYALLFGEILGVSPGDVLLTLATGGLALAAIALLFRPLLFASVDEDVAEARGVPVRLLSVLFMLVLAVAVAVAVQVVGILLIFSLLVTPAATAERLARSPGRVMALAVLIALGCTWAGLAIGYYYPYPVSCFITTLAFLSYLVVRLTPWLAGRLRRSPAQLGGVASEPGESSAGVA